MPMPLATAGAAATAVPLLSSRRSTARLRLSGLPTPQPQRQRLSAVTSVLKRNPKRLKYSAERLYKKGEESGMLYVEMDPLGQDTWKLDPVIKLIKGGAVGVIPTDTVYAIVCDLKNHSSIERLRRIKDIDYSKPLSILCYSLHDIDTYTTGFPRGNAQGQTNIFRAVKQCVPGPYTFILPASKALPKQCRRYGTYTSRKEVGVRIPDDAICRAILENLDAPLICTSVKWPAKDHWMVDPVIIADIYEPEGLDFIVDGGIRVADPSTVVDMTRSTPTIIRQGKEVDEAAKVSKVFPEHFSINTQLYLTLLKDQNKTGWWWKERTLPHKGSCPFLD